jgi:hypothetical protein
LKPQKRQRHNHVEPYSDRNSRELSGDISKQDESDDNDDDENKAEELSEYEKFRLRNIDRNNTVVYCSFVLLYYFFAKCCENSIVAQLGQMMRAIGLFSEKFKKGSTRRAKKKRGNNSYSRPASCPTSVCASHSSEATSSLSALSSSKWPCQQVLHYFIASMAAI